MKRLLLLPILCLMPAAQAVDYVKCEAMNKAYGRLVERRHQAMLDAEKAVREKACGVKMDAQIQSIKQKDYSILDRHMNCVSAAEYSAEAIAAGKAAKAKVQVQIDKVQADYAAEGCY